MGLDPCSTCVDRWLTSEYGRRSRECRGFIYLEFAASLSLFILASYGAIDGSGSSLLDSMPDFGLTLTGLAAGVLAMNLARGNLKARRWDIIVLTLSTLAVAAVGMLSANGVLPIQTAGAVVIVTFYILSGLVNGVLRPKFERWRRAEERVREVMAADDSDDEPVAPPPSYREADAKAPDRAPEGKGPEPEG